MWGTEYTLWYKIYRGWGVFFFRGHFFKDSTFFQGTTSFERISVYAATPPFALDFGVWGIVPA